MQPYHTLECLGSLLLNILRFVECQDATLSYFEGVMQPYHTLMGLGSRLLSLLRFVKRQMQPYQTLKGLGSLLLSLLRFVKCQDATLSHFEGVVITFT